MTTRIREQDLQVSVTTEGVNGLGGTHVKVVHLPTGLSVEAGGKNTSQLQLKAQTLRSLEQALAEQDWKP